jgi:DNA-directed RNA polymerase subunit A'
VLDLFGRAGIDMELTEKDSFTGKEIFSLMLPKGLNIEFKSSSCKQCDACVKEKCTHDAWVKIKDGHLQAGTIDSSAVGAFKGKIISKMHRVTDNEFIKNFIDNCGRLAVSYLVARGFTIGISDLDLPDNVMADVNKRVDQAEKEANELIAKFSHRQLKILPGLTAEQSLETQILNVLSGGLNDISEVVEREIKPSDVIIMANSGAKGSFVNITQMSACVGQETILGQRIKRGYLKRTLPHFKKGDLSADAHGFVKTGFKQALTPTELFWNVMNGREGLMDKSLRTRKSGYMQRRLINALQDLHVNHSMVVRNSAGQIVQFKAGEDAVDPAKSDAGGVNWKN